MMFHKSVALPAFSALIAFSATAFSEVDPAARVVEVRSDCTAQMNNCFAHPYDLLSWMNKTRRPKAAAPLAVTLYPEVFTGLFSLVCDPASGYTGYTSFQGSGNGQTILRATAFNSPLNVSNCTSMSFSHLTINGQGYGGVTWSGGGTSKWTDVDIIGAGRAWYEPACGASRGSHYWSGGRIQATAGFTVVTPYVAECDESWFFGTELTAIVPPGETGNGAVVSATNGGIVHAYGSVIRLFADGPGDVHAVHVGAIGIPNNTATGGEIHIHGTGIDVFSDTGRDVVVMRASGGGMLHANQAAYNIHTTGSVTRLEKTADAGHTSAPYAWGESAEAPAVTTVTGADTAVVTNTLDGQPHIVVSSSNCDSGWYDTTLGACRR